jgi:hypothetical protein
MSKAAEQGYWRGACRRQQWFLPVIGVGSPLSLPAMDTLGLWLGPTLAVISEVAGAASRGARAASSYAP